MGVKIYGQVALTQEVMDLLEMPREKASKVVSAIAQAMTQAILRGETIMVRGFGKFYLRKRKATRRGCCYNFYPGLKKKDIFCEVLDIPAKNIVIFEQYKPLRKMLDDYQPPRD